MVLFIINMHISNFIIDNITIKVLIKKNKVRATHRMGLY